MRSYINHQTSYTTQKRDQYIQHYGILAHLLIPNEEDPIDFFGDLPTLPDRSDLQIYCNPLYSNYFQVVNLIGGQHIEEDLPLEVEVKVSDYIPNDSILVLPLVPVDNNTSINLPTTHWRVISSEIKMLETIYARVLKCVPMRVNTGF